MYYFAYRPPNQCKTDFFDEISSPLNKMINKYENALLAGDLTVVLLDSNKHHTNHLPDLTDSFNVTNLVVISPKKDL